MQAASVIGEVARCARYTPLSAKVVIVNTRRWIECVDYEGFPCRWISICRLGSECALRPTANVEEQEQQGGGDKWRMRRRRAAHCEATTAQGSVGSRWMFALSVSQQEGHGECQDKDADGDEEDEKGGVRGKIHGCKTRYKTSCLVLWQGRSSST